MNQSFRNTTNNFEACDDIHGLYAVVNNTDNNVSNYQEINFNESIAQIHQKWPLLNEIQNTRIISDQTQLRQII